MIATQRRPGTEPADAATTEAFVAALPLARADLQVLLRVNRLRRAPPCCELAGLEAALAARFDADRHLAVYGSLAPGRGNHTQLASVPGSWHGGLNVRGDLGRGVDGSAAGYALLRWSPSGSPVPVELFVSDELSRHWPRLDVFEGESYVRLLVPVLRGDQPVAVANVYAGEA